MTRFLHLCLVVAGLTSALALYSPGGSVVILDESNFAAKIKQGPHMVEFFAPWCGHCKALTPEWEKAAKALKGLVSVGAVDADAHQQLGAQYGVKGFPTIKFVYHDGSTIKTSDYNGGRTAKDIVSFAMDKAKSLALKRIGAKASSSSSSSSSTGGGGGGFYSSSSKVVNLREDNFEKQVKRDDSPWFVEFFAPWCGHCKNLKPEYISAAKELDGKVKFGAINCDEEKALCGQYGVQGYPTVKFFGRNKSSPQDYDGARTSSGLVSYGTEQWSKLAPPPEVRELTSPDLFAEHCTGTDASPPQQLCFLAFLPDILDSQASGRNAYLKTLRQVAEGFKDRPYSYFWAQGGAQPGLEANVEVGGFGYPAVAAYSPKRDVYVPLKGALELAQMKEWIGAIRAGHQGGIKLRGELASIKTTEGWDGKDGKLDEEDEFDLSDLMNEEL